jgi:transposase
MQVTTYAVDLAKRVFQVHGVEAQSGEVKRKTLLRQEVSEFFAQREVGVVAMEACGSAHHWGRLLSRLGHQVRLVSAQFVRPFVKTNKTEAADAHAIWEAAQRPEMRSVGLKSEEQQALLSLHRIRQQLVKVRTMQAPQIRSLLYEFGIALPKSWRVLLLQAGPVLADPTRNEIPQLLRAELLSQLESLRSLTSRIHQLEQAIASYRGRLEDCRRIEAIPGIGRLSFHSAHRDDWRCPHVPLGARDGRLPGSGSSPVGHRRAGPTAGYQQARRSVSAHAADPWCSLCDHTG